MIVRSFTRQRVYVGGEVNAPGLIVLPVSEEQRKYIVQANSMTKQRQYGQAQAKFLKVIEVDPTSYPAAYSNMALLAAQENQTRTAIFRMKQYLMLVPDAGDARSAQDKIYEWEGRIGK